MRVTVLAASGQLGGAERMVLETVRALSTLGFESTVVALEPGPLLDATRREGAGMVDVLRLSSGLATLGDAGRSKAAVVIGLLRAAAPLPFYVRQLAGILQRHATEVIHSHGIKTHVLAALVPRRRPVVWHLHDYVGLRPMSSALLRRLARRCDLVLAVSDSVAQDCRRWLPQEIPVIVLHNAVDTERFCPDGPRRRSRRDRGPASNAAADAARWAAGDLRAVEGPRRVPALAGGRCSGATSAVT